jgi:hypothetical protein
LEPATKKRKQKKRKEESEEEGGGAAFVRFFFFCFCFFAPKLRSKESKKKMTSKECPIVGPIMLAHQAIFWMNVQTLGFCKRAVRTGNFMNFIDD